MTEARTGNDANASLFQQQRAVVGVGHVTLGLGLGNELGGQRDLREGVHGALDRLAADAVNGVERVGNQLRLLLQLGQDVGLFLLRK